MTDFRVIPERDVRLYRVEGPAYLHWMGRNHQIVEVDMERDVHHPDQYAIQVTTTTNLVATFESTERDTWPSIIRMIDRRLHD